MSREELLRVTSEEDIESFLNVVKQHESKDSDFNLHETVESLSHKQVDELWTSLNQMCTSAVFSFSTEDDEEELRKTSQVLQGILLVAMATVQQKDVMIPLALMETTILLHGVLISIPEEMSKLQTSIARLCEYWWTHNLRERKEIAVNTIIYHLEKSVLPNTTIADIKRVWTLRECLHEVKFENESSEKLKSLLKEAMASTKYLKNDEGRRFLSFLFGISPSMIESLHMTIKNQIPYCSVSLLPLYGEVYFRAWKVATGTSLEKIEVKCLQDLMYRAIHAMRGSSNSMASRLKKLLGFIHKQKKQHGVDQMLLKLYEPFLWRSLKVANGLVRANAVGILIDVFPLMNPEASNEEGDAQMQKQFDTLLTLLEDPVVIVRASTVHGVFHILSVYWELIPREMVHSFLTKLLQDLARDSASAEVRVAVLTGLAHLLDNHLSHPALKLLLPAIKNLLHDNSEMVRIAFMELLQRVKRLKPFKLWSIVPMEHLLARLELDGSPVCKRIMELIFNSFVPADKPPEEQLYRVMRLIKINRGGARKFFKYAQLHMSPSSVAKFMILLCRFVIQCVRRETKNSTEKNGDTSVDDQSSAEEEKENEDEEDSIVSAKDTNIMAGLLETIIILWEGSGIIFKGSDNELKKNLDNVFSRALPEMFKFFHDQEVCACLILLAGFLPANTIPTFSRSLLSKLKGMHLDNTPDEYGPLIESMCKWCKAGDLIELISDWVEASVVPKDLDESSKKSKASKGVRFDAPVEPKPQLGLAYLRYMTGHALCREMILNHNRDDLVTVVTLLRDVMKCIQTRIQCGEAGEESLSDEVLVELFEEYLRLEILLHKDRSETDAVEAFEKVVIWSGKNLLPLLKQRRQHKRRLLTQSETTMMSQEGTMMGDTTLPTLSTTLLSTTLKRGAGGDAIEYGITDLAAKLIKSLLNVSSDMCLVGIGSYKLASHFADFTVNLLGTEDSVRLLPEVANLMYQITEFMLSRQRINKEPKATTEDNEESENEDLIRADMVPEMLKKVMSMLSHLVRVKKELAERVLPTLKSAMAEMIISYYHHQSLNQTMCKDVMSIIVAGVVAEMTTTMRKDNFFERVGSISALPLLSSFILGIMVKRTSITSVFVDELFNCIDSGAIENMEGLLGILHVLFAMNKSKARRSNLKDCLLAVQKHFEAMESPESGDDNSPYKHLHQTTGTLLKDVMTDVG